MFHFGECGVLLTKNGLNILSAGISGKPITISRVAIGSGEMQAETREDYEQQVLNLENIIEWRMDIPIAELLNEGDGLVRLHCIKSNAEVTEGFFARERAVFAINPDTGQEILYAYINTGDSSSFIPSNTGPIAKVIDFSIETVIQNAADVKVILNPDFAYVDIQRYLAHVNSEHPHINTPNFYGEVSTADNFWVTDSDSNLYKMNVEAAKDLLLPEVRKDFAADHALLLENDIYRRAKMQLGLDANLIIYEDFQNPSEQDNFSVKVVSCAKGGILVGVESDENILPGHFYKISDGVNAEIIQISGVNNKNDYFNVTLTKPLTFDYLDDLTKIYRTTFNHTNTDKRALSWSFEPFTGVAANVQRVLFLNTNNANKKSHVISGEGFLSEDGYFCLNQSVGRITEGADTMSGGGDGGCCGDCSCCAKRDTCSMRV